jgi:hypothetical protein
MPETSDNWPAPAYRVPSAKYLHALGVISLNYNTFEHYLLAIFAHHLQRMGVSGAFGEFVFHEFNMQRAIKECYQRHEKDPETLVHMAKALDIPVMALFEGADVSRSTIQSELAGLVINQNAMRLLRAFSKINRTSSQRALVTLAEHIAGEH